jgi:hypothetical protein
MSEVGRQPAFASGRFQVGRTERVPIQHGLAHYVTILVTALAKVRGRRVEYHVPSRYNFLRLVRPWVRLVPDPTHLVLSPSADALEKIQQ